MQALAEQTAARAPNMLAQAHTHLRLDLGGYNFAATLFGNRSGNDWSLSLLACAEETKRQEYTERLGNTLCSLTVGEAFMSNATSFNALILDSEAFTAKTSLGGHWLRRAFTPAEGTSLKVGDAGVQSPAGCLTIVMTRLGYDPLKFHAGRWSLFDRNRRLGIQDRYREHDSACHAALQKLGVTSPEDAAEVHVKILWGIRPENFLHSLEDDYEHFESNSWLCRRIVELEQKIGFECATIRGRVAYLDLARIAAAQMIERGVPSSQIDLAHGYLPKTGTYTDGSLGKPRNLVVVKYLGFTAKKN